MRYACMKPVVCPTDFMKLNGGCYKLFATTLATAPTDEQIKDKVIEITKYCNSFGAGLSRITTLKQARGIGEYMKVCTN